MKNGLILALTVLITIIVCSLYLIFPADELAEFIGYPQSVFAMPAMIGAGVAFSIYALCTRSFAENRTRLVLFVVSGALSGLVPTLLMFIFLMTVPEYL